MGLPNSGKTTLATNLNNIIKFDILNADKIRAKENDWDFSLEGRLRQANRMKVYADRLISEGKNVIADFICPTKKTRKIFSADYIIWMNTIKKGKFEDTNLLFEKPSKEEINYEIIEKKKDNVEEVIISLKKSGII